MNNSNIDFLIVGAGLYGCTMARILTDSGFKCLIIDKRNHIGGKCFSYPHESGLYDIHLYGPHIFHTSDINVAQFITNYTKFNNHQQNIIAKGNNKFYNIPFNMNTFLQLFDNLENTEDAYNRINKECKNAKRKYGIRNDLEATAQKLFGKTIYNILIKEYYKKKFDKNCYDIDGSIINHFLLNYSFDNNYFNDIFCGIPVDGYDIMFERIINGNSYDDKLHNSISYILNTDFIESIDFWLNLPEKKIIYCGAVDELLNYELGELEWYSLIFENEEYDFNGHNSQGCSIMNFVDNTTKATRCIEHMYFTPEKWKNNTNFKSVKTYEYPEVYKHGKERYYPVNNEHNNKLYIDYIDLLSKTYPNVIPGGYIGKYKYLDMGDTIKEAIIDSSKIISYYKNMSNDE